MKRTTSNFDGNNHLTDPSLYSDYTQSSASSPLLVPKSFGINTWAQNRANAGIIRNAITVATKEECRAHLTKAALQNVGALSTIEMHLTNVAPNGAGRYQHIVDAYVLATANRIITF